MPSKTMTKARALAGAIEWLEELVRTDVCMPPSTRNDIKSDLEAYKAAQSKGKQ